MAGDPVLESPPSPLYEEGEPIPPVDTPTRPKKRQRGVGLESSLPTPPATPPDVPSGVRQRRRASARIEKKNSQQSAEASPVVPNDGDTPKTLPTAVMGPDTDPEQLRLFETPPRHKTDPASSPSPSRLSPDVQDHIKSSPRRSLRRSSTPSTPSSQKTIITSSYQIDDKIAGQLKSRAKNKDAKIVGCTYVFRVATKDNENTNIIKIGFTKNSRTQRVGEIYSSCKHERIEAEHDSELQDIPRSTVIEKLAQFELLPFKQNFKCDCSKSHGEYFDIGPRVALRVVQRWRRFSQREPWDEQGNLKPFWQHRLATRPPCDKSESLDDYESRAERWERFVSPSWLECFIWDVQDWYSKISRWWWQITTFVNAMLLVVSTWNTGFSSMAVCNVAFTVCCIGIPQLGLTTPTVFNAVWGGFKPDAKVQPLPSSCKGKAREGAGKEVVKNVDAEVELAEIAQQGLLISEEPVEGGSGKDIVP